MDEQGQAAATAVFCTISGQRWAVRLDDVRRIIPAEQAGSVPGAVSHVIDGAGHMAHMERPAEVQAAIEETITRG